MSRENSVVDFETDFLPYFRSKYAKWFPENRFDNDTLEGYFDYAAYAKLIDNTKSSMARFGPSESKEDGQRLYLYCLVVAHICYLDGRGPGMTGQITSGTQGSVSAGTQALGSNGDLSDYWKQSQWGIRFLMATRYLGRMRYIPPLRQNWK